MANRKAVDFAQFVGEGLLSGVWFSNEPFVRDWENDDAHEKSQVCYFMWQGEIYRAQEDPDDGYRSSLGPFVVIGGRLPYDVWDPSERCTVERVREEPIDEADRDWRTPQRCDLLVFKSCVTGKVVLTIGTTNTDDYYPGCVLHFDPRNLSHNQGEVRLMGPH